MTFVQQYTQKLDEYLKREDNVVTRNLARVELMTGVSRLYLANTVIIVFIAYMIFGSFAQLICNLIGFVYPAYASLGALNAPPNEQHTIDQIQHLLRYWVVFAFMSLADFFSGYLFRIIPFYWLSKMVFLVWCLAPIPNNGSTFLYVRFIQPVFKQVEPIIDNTFTSLLSQIHSKTQELSQELNKSQ